MKRLNLKLKIDKMKREIKFRVWIKPEHWDIDNNEGLMTNGLPLGGWDKWWLNLNPQLKNQQSLDGEFTLDMISIMQYTGLKDKNGKEIYEDDYVILTEDDGFSYGRGFVQFYKGGFQINDMHLQDFFYENLIIEVIGNKHENPELI